MYNFYETFSCQELYAFFFELALKELNDKGVLSFITASLYIKGLKFETLRCYLENHLDLIEYKYQGDDIFQNVKMPTATILGYKGKGNWSCADLNPLTKLARKISFGQKQLFQISDIQRGLEISRGEVLSSGKYPCITGTLVNKYLPHTIKYISQSTLDNNAKEERFFTNERILLRETGSFLMAIYLNEHLYSNRSLYSILITDKSFKTKYVLACLNSSLLQFYYKVMFKAETDLFPKIRIAQAKLLPIPKADDRVQKEVIGIVDKIISAKRENVEADISEYEKQIDEIVFGLFDLTQEEIALIEQA